MRSAARLQKIPERSLANALLDKPNLLQRNVKIVPGQIPGLMRAVHQLLVGMRLADGAGAGKVLHLLQLPGPAHGQVPILAGVEGIGRRIK